MLCADSSVLRDAIARRHPVACLRGGELTVFCPHAIRRHGGRLYVLAFVLLGGRAAAAREAAGLPWAWLLVEELTGVVRVEGGWHSAPPETAPPLGDARPAIDGAGCTA